MLRESKITHSVYCSDKKLIGLAGPARSGKDTAAKFLIQQGFHHYYFAKPLYEALSVMLGMPVQELALHKEEVIFPFGKTIRFMLQTLGTEWAREIVDPDFWVKLADQQYQQSIKPMVISDVRFENEANWIRQQGGVVFHVNRPVRTEIDNANHKSEAGLRVEGFDFVINNNGSLDHLKRQVLEAYQQYNWFKHLKEGGQR